MSYLSRIELILKKTVPSYSRHTISVNYSRDVKDEKAIYNEDEDGKPSLNEVLVDPIDLAERARNIHRLRNKSGMTKMHRKILFQEPVSPNEISFDRSLLISRRQYGQFGEASCVNPRLCFQTPEENADREEFNRVAYPFTVVEVIERAKAVKTEKEDARRKRDNQIGENMKKLDKWIADMRDRVAKKEEMVRLSKERREQFIEEIRQELGFKIDRKDPRFLELVEKKEMQFKKAAKSARQKVQSIKRDEALKSQYEKSLVGAAGLADDDADTDNDENLARTISGDELVQGSKKE